MQTALVTGGAGFIGSHLCKCLLNKGYHVICVDNFLTGQEKNIELLKSDSKFELVRHDVNYPLPKNIYADFVYHLASPASPNHHSKLSYHALPMETMMVNTVGTRNMLEFSLQNNAKFLFTSTSEVYGDPLEHPQKETYRGNVSTTGPRSVYDEAKRFGETLTAYYFREKGLDGRIVRIFNTYGPHMMPGDMRMIIVFITQSLKNQPITIFGDGRQTRSLCYVSDTVEGIFRVMTYPHTKRKIVNIGSCQEHTVLEYAQMVKDLTHSDSEIVFSEVLPEDDPLRRRADISFAKELLDWEPEVNLKDGLLKIIEYFKTIKD